MHTVLGALAFAGLVGAQFMAAIVLTTKPAELDPRGPTPRRDAERPSPSGRRALGPSAA